LTRSRSASTRNANRLMPADYLTNKLTWNSYRLLSCSYSLNALALTCRRLQKTLQHSLEVRITQNWAKTSSYGPPPSLACTSWSPSCSCPHTSFRPSQATASKKRHVPPCRSGNSAHAHIAPGPRRCKHKRDPHRVWMQDTCTPLHLAMKPNDLVTAALLLDRGVCIDAGYGCSWASLYALHDPCARGNFDMVALLPARGAHPELRGHHGTAPGSTLHARA
jgi:hypothetical protein